MVKRDVRRTRRIVVRHASTPPAAPTEPTPDSTPEPSAEAITEPEATAAPDTATPDTTTPGVTLGPGTTVATTEPDPAPEHQAQDHSYGFPTEASLDDHVAAADELRADLDRLRRQLDDGPPPLTPARKRNRKPLFGALIVGGTAAAIAVLVPWSDLDPNRSTPAPSTATGESGAQAAQPSAAPAPRPAPAGSLPATGPGIDAPGTMMLVRVTQNGTLNVVEQAVLGPRGLSELSLRLPSMASLGGQVAQLSPTVHDLRVSVNGTPVAATPTAVGPGWAVAAAGGQPARTVQLSYQIEDAIVRPQTSSSGRALGVSLPLLGQALREQGLPLVVRAEGVGGATCPSAPPAKMLCGEEVGDGWLATIPAEAASPTLLLQLNLKS